MKIYTHSTKKLLLIIIIIINYDSSVIIWLLQTDQDSELRNGKGEGGLNLNFFTEFFTWLVLW